MIVGRGTDVRLPAPNELDVIGAALDGDRDVSVPRDDGPLVVVDPIGPDPVRLADVDALDGNVDETPAPLSVELPVVLDSELEVGCVRRTLGPGLVTLDVWDTVADVVELPEVVALDRLNGVTAETPAVGSHGCGSGVRLTGGVERGVGLCGEAGACVIGGRVGSAEPGDAGLV